MIQLRNRRHTGFSHRFSVATAFGVAVLGTFLGLLPTHAVAQFRGEPERENVRISGVVTDLGPGILQVTDKGGEVWLVKVERGRGEISYTATATPDWLRPGMWVRVRAGVNQKLQVVTPVNEITVFTPREGLQLGIVPEVSLGQDIFAAQAPEEKADKDKPTPCMIAGRLAGIKKNKLTIAAGQGVVTIDVPETVKVNVELSDISLTRPGDKVEIAGWKYAMIPGRAMANTVSVSAEKPLTGPGAKSSRSGRDKARGEDATEEPSTTEEKKPAEGDQPTGTAKPEKP